MRFRLFKNSIVSGDLNQATNTAGSVKIALQLVLRAQSIMLSGVGEMGSNSGDVTVGV
jgi:hypothetical protein